MMKTERQSFVSESISYPLVLVEPVEVEQFSQVYVKVNHDEYDIYIRTEPSNPVSRLDKFTYSIKILNMDQNKVEIFITIDHKFKPFKSVIRKTIHVTKKSEQPTFISSISSDRSYFGE